MINTLGKLSSIRLSARRRNKEFSLGLLYTNNLLKQTHCAYSGVKFDDKNPQSFERVDNDKGYVEGNVIVVSCAINNARSNYTDEQIKERLGAAVKLHAELLISLDKKGVPLEGSEEPIDDHHKTLLNAIKRYQSRLELQRGERIKFENIIIKNTIDAIPGLDAENARLRKHIALIDEHIEGFIKKIAANLVSVENYVKSKANKSKAAKSADKEKRDQIKSLELKISYYKILLQSSDRFKNLNKREKAAMSIGLPLDSKWSAVLKNKIIHKLLGKA